MKETKSVTIKVIFEYDYTESVNEMIADGEISNKKEIEDYVRDTVIEDIINSEFDPEFTNMKIKIS
jgi:hypothetical protein